MCKWRTIKATTAGQGGTPHSFAPISSLNSASSLLYCKWKCYFEVEGCVVLSRSAAVALRNGDRKPITRVANEWPVLENSNLPHSFTFSFEYSNIYSNLGHPRPMPRHWRSSSLHARKGKYCSGNSFCNFSFQGLQMIQFECPKVIHSLVSLNFGVYCGVPFSLHTGKWKCCMWSVKKWKFILQFHV